MTSSTPTSPLADMTRFDPLHTSRMADEGEDPGLLEGIKYPGKHDVMLGRGGESTYHSGNISFRQLVEEHKTTYYAAQRAHKSHVVAEVVRKWRLLTPPGRFLTRSQPGAGDRSQWHDVGDRRALKKASHSLRDAVRCFSVEKKHREQQQRGRPEEEVVTSSDRKRGREELVMVSTTATKSGGAKLVVAARSKNAIVAVEERPAKKQRVIWDERDDCGYDEDDAPLPREGCDDERDSGRDECNIREAADSIPDIIPAARQYIGGSCSSRERPPPQLPVHNIEFPQLVSKARQSTIGIHGLLDLNLLNTLVQRTTQHQRGQQQQKRMPSPCGSADWFTPVTEDLPVRGVTSTDVLPTAEALVREVAVSKCTTTSNSMSANCQEVASDDDSLGWFEEDQAVAAFTTGMPLHRPVGVRSANTGRPADVGREL